MKARRGHRHEGGEGPHPPYAWRRIDRALFRTSAFPSVHLSAAIMPQLGVPGNRGAGDRVLLLDPVGGGATQGKLHRRGQDGTPGRPMCCIGGRRWRLAEDQNSVPENVEWMGVNGLPFRPRPSNLPLPTGPEPSWQWLFAQLPAGLPGG